MTAGAQIGKTFREETPGGSLATLDQPGWRFHVTAEGAHPRDALVQSAGTALTRHFR